MTRTTSPLFLRLALASAVVLAVAIAVVRAEVRPGMARDAPARLVAAAQVAVVGGTTGQPTAARAQAAAALAERQSGRASRQERGRGDDDPTAGPATRVPAPSTAVVVRRPRHRHWWDLLLRG